MSGQSSQGYVGCLNYLINEAIHYYRVCRQKSYNWIMIRINMGCDIYPREKSFWDLEAEKTITVIDKYIYDMKFHDMIEAKDVNDWVKEQLADIDSKCDAYKWYKEKKEEPEPVEETEWDAGDFVIRAEDMRY